MTIGEFLILFKTRFDKLDTAEYPEVLPEQIADLYYLAVKTVIKNRYGLNNVYQKSYEQIQKRTDDIKHYVRLITLGEISDIQTDPSGILFDNRTLYNKYIFLVKQPDDFMCYIKSLFKIQISVLNEQCVQQAKEISLPVRIESNDDLYNTLRDPFATDASSSIIGCFEGEINENLNYGGLTLYSEYIGAAPQLIMTYIRNPNRFIIIRDVDGVITNLNTILDMPSVIEEDVLEKTLQLAMEAIESTRLSTQQVVLTGTE